MLTVEDTPTAQSNAQPSAQTQPSGRHNIPQDKPHLAPLTSQRLPHQQQSQTLSRMAPSSSPEQHVDAAPIGEHLANRVPAESHPNVAAAAPAGTTMQTSKKKQHAEEAELPPGPEAGQANSMATSGMKQRVSRPAVMNPAGRYAHAHQDEGSDIAGPSASLQTASRPSKASEEAAKAADSTEPMPAAARRHNATGSNPIAAGVSHAAGAGTGMQAKGTAQRSALPVGAAHQDFNRENVIVLDDANDSQDISVSIGGAAPMQTAFSGGSMNAHESRTHAANASASLRHQHHSSGAPAVDVHAAAADSAADYLRVNQGIRSLRPAADGTQAPDNVRTTEDQLQGVGSEAAPEASRGRRQVEGLQANGLSSSQQAPNPQQPQQQQQGVTSSEQNTHGLAGNATTNVLWGRKSGHAYRANPPAEAPQPQQTQQPGEKTGTHGVLGNQVQGTKSMASTSLHAQRATRDDSSADAGTLTGTDHPSGKDAAADRMAGSSAASAGLATSKHGAHPAEPPRGPVATAQKKSAASASTSVAVAATAAAAAAPSADTQTHKTLSAPDERVGSQSAVPIDVHQAASDIDDSDHASADDGEDLASQDVEVEVAAPEPGRGGNLAGNLVSAIRSFLPMGQAKSEAAPAAGKKPVKVFADQSAGVS